MKILSIDFDIIMYHCIKLYNNFSAGNANPTQLWQQLEDEYEISQHLNYDATVLNNILILMIKNVQNNAKFIPIKSHEELITYLENNQLLNENECEVTNIDFHHDILYQEADLAQIKYFNKKTCANWVGYLNIHNYLKNITWVKAPNSDNYTWIENDNIKDKLIIETLNNIINLDSNYDYIFFCESPQWVPYKYHHLYTLCCNVINTIQENSLNLEEENSNDQ